jgi:signal transduction histidine kinase
VTAASHAAVKLAEVKEAYAEGGLTRTDFAAFLDDGEQTAAILSSNLDRAAALVSSFKKIAVDAAGEERRFFRPKEYMGDILASLSPRLKRTKLRFEIDCPEDLEIDSYPGPFAQVFTNLVLNSLEHGYPEPAEGLVRLGCELKRGTLTWTYSDDGR